MASPVYNSPNAVLGSCHRRHHQLSRPRCNHCRFGYFQYFPPHNYTNMNNTNVIKRVSVLQS